MYAYSYSMLILIFILILILMLILVLILISTTYAATMMRRPFAVSTVSNATHVVAVHLKVCMHTPILILILILILMLVLILCCHSH